MLLSVLRTIPFEEGTMLKQFVISIVFVFAAGHCAAVPSEPCTAKHIGQTMMLTENSSSCQLCKCSAAKQWVCVDATKLKFQCKTPNCDKSEWEPDPTALCCLRCRKEPTCRLGQVSHPCADAPCFECVCQDILGIPTLTCADVSSKCPNLNCTDKKTPSGQCCPRCATTFISRNKAAQTAAKTAAKAAAAALRKSSPKMKATATTRITKSPSKAKTIASAPKSCKKKCPVLYCEATITPPGACCPICA